MFSPEKMVPIPPAEKVSLFKDFQLPDLSALKKEEWQPGETVETEIDIEGVKYPCKCTFERYRDDEREDISKYNPMQIAQLHVEFFDPANPEKRLGVFKGALSRGPWHTDGAPPDTKNHTYWRIYTRRIEKEMRKGGMGTAGLRAFEELVERMSAAEPRMKYEWIEIRTLLSSLTRMVISQKWLEDHELFEYLKKTGSHDFKYIPLAEDEYAVAGVLRKGTEELADVKGNATEICLYKMKED